MRNADYDIMDMSRKEFEEEWYAFRRSTKLVDLRLASLTGKGRHLCTRLVNRGC